MGRVLTGLGLESRQTLAQPPEWLKSVFGTGATTSGKTVSVEGSLSLVPVYSAVTLIAGTIGTLPLIVYRRISEGGKERAENHRAWSLLHRQPNPEMAADEVWEMIAAHLCLWGNAFCWKEKDRAGQVTWLWPLNPARVEVGRQPSGRRYFLVDGEHIHFEDTILHIRGLSAEGLVGYSPVQLAKEALGIRLAQEEFQGRFLNNQGRPSVILKHPNTLSEDAAKRLKSSWDSIKAGGTAVLEEAISVEKWTMPLDDAQFLESKQLSNLDIALLFQVPPGKLGAKTGDSLTYSTTELQGIDFVTYTLRRWLVRIERALLRDESIFVQGERFFAEFLVDGLLRADAKSRWETYKTAVEIGVMSPDEVRERENLPARQRQPELQEPSPNGGGEADEEMIEEAIT